MLSIKNVKKIVVVSLASMAMFGAGALTNSIANNSNNTVNADNLKNKELEIGTNYKLGNLSLNLKEYTYKGKVNYIITTNLKKKDFYSVGANTDKSGKTHGVTIGYGNDCK